MNIEKKCTLEKEQESALRISTIKLPGSRLPLFDPSKNLHSQGLSFQTCIWLLAGSIRYHRWIVIIADSRNEQWRHHHYDMSKQCDGDTIPCKSDQCSCSHTKSKNQNFCHQPAWGLSNCQSVMLYVFSHTVAWRWKWERVHWTKQFTIQHLCTKLLQKYRCQCGLKARGSVLAVTWGGKNGIMQWHHCDVAAMEQGGSIIVRWWQWLKGWQQREEGSSKRQAYFSPLSHLSKRMLTSKWLRKTVRISTNEHAMMVGGIGGNNVPKQWHEDKGRAGNTTAKCEDKVEACCGINVATPRVEAFGRSGSNNLPVHQQRNLTGSSMEKFSSFLDNTQYCTMPHAFRMYMVVK